MVLRGQIESEQQTINNLMNLCDEKDQKLSRLEEGMGELEEKHNEIEKLHEENEKHHKFAEDLLDQIKRISEENNRLTEQLYMISSQGSIKDSFDG